MLFTDRRIPRRLLAVGALLTTVVASTATHADANSPEPIRLGVLADFSGPFADLSPLLLQGQQAYFDMVNAEGGIDGRPIELIVRDNGYDIATQIEQYDDISDDVVAFSMSLGEPTTAAIADRLADEELLAIPISWGSNWNGVPNVLALQASYCSEAINAVGTLMQPGDRVALIRLPGAFGDDAATGVHAAAEEHGVEIVSDVHVFDTASFFQAANELAALQPDWAYVALVPGFLSNLVGLADLLGYGGNWTGAGPSWNPTLLAGPSADILVDSYVISSPVSHWGDAVRGMDEMIAAGQASAPEGPASDPFVLGWTQARAMTTLLERAADDGDVSRAGVLAAAQRGNLQFDQLSPKEKLGRGEHSAVRATAFYRPSLDAFAASQGATTGYGELLASEPLHPLGVSEMAKRIDIAEACPAPQP